MVKKTFCIGLVGFLVFTAVVFSATVYSMSLANPSSEADNKDFSFYDRILSPICSSLQFSLPAKPNNFSGTHNMKSDENFMPVNSDRASVGKKYRIPEPSILLFLGVWLIGIAALGRKTVRRHKE